MATAHQIRDLVAQTTTGTARPRVPREVRDEVCRYAGRRRREGAAWAMIARETGLELARKDELHRRREGHVLAGCDRAALAADPRRRGVNALEK